MSVQDRSMVCARCTIGSEIVLDAPDAILGDVGHVESHFFLFGDSVSVGWKARFDPFGDRANLDAR